MDVIFYLVVLAIAMGVSWAGTVGIIYLITLCFSLNFNLLHATGIWLILLLVLPKGGSKK